MVIAHELILFEETVIYCFSCQCCCCCKLCREALYMEIPPRNEQKSESSFANVYELPGEPAIVINGVPDIPASDTAVTLCNSLNEEALLGHTGFGEWLEGRDVHKMFGDRYYYGIVAEFDKESGWYRLEYEDGDFEDVDWRGLEEVLLPMDITVPLRALALKTLRRSKKSIHKSGKNKGRLKQREAKENGGRVKTGVENEMAMVLPIEPKSEECGIKEMVDKL